MRREADGREEDEPLAGRPRDPARRAGAVRSPSTPGQKLPGRALPASGPLLPRGSPALWPPRRDPFLPGALGPQRSCGPQNPSPRASPGLLPAALPGGRDGSPFGPLRPGCFKCSLSLLSRKNVWYRPSLPASSSMGDSVARASRHLIYQGPRNPGPSSIVVLQGSRTTAVPPDPLGPKSQAPLPSFLL